MKEHKAFFRWRRFRTIPRKLKIIWILLSILCVLAVLSVLKSPTAWMKNMKQAELNIDEITSKGSRSVTGSNSYKICIRANGEKYYLWCPYSNFESIRAYLLSGENSTVTVQYVRSNPITTAIDGKRIVDCRSDDMVFYGIDDELRMAKYDRISAGVLLCISLILWIADTVWVVTVYGVLTWKKKCH